MAVLSTVGLLILSNTFMVYAWYAHLKDFKSQPMWAAIFISWGIAFFEYCIQVPANRLGNTVMSLPQLKILQEVITLAVFAGLYAFYWQGELSWNYLAAGCCLLLALGFIFWPG